LETEYNESSYAFLVENEVFHVFHSIGVDPSIAEGYKEGFNNNPIGIDLEYYPLAMRGDIWNGSNFSYNPEQAIEAYDGTSMKRSSMPSLDTSKFSRYGFVSNNKLFFAMIFPKGTDQDIMWKNAIKTGAKAIDVSEYSNIETGDRLINDAFVKADSSQVFKDGTSSWSKWKSNLGDARPWHMINPSQKKVETDVAKKRMSLCSDCPFLVKATTTCTKCGCFMKLKTRLEGSECPIGKW
jgi:hypothetical protein